MNRSLSSKAAKKPSPAPGPAKKKKPKKTEQNPRNPLKDLNVISTTSNHGSVTSSASASASASISIEAPRGCLRFFLSHSSNLKTPCATKARTLSKTPKSAPIVMPSKSKSHVSKNPPKSKMKSSSGNVPSPRNVLKSKAFPDQPNEVKSSSSDEISTPVCKIVPGLGFDSKADETSKKDSTTSPVQASVSPEIQFGSSAVSSASLACYAAGHVLSGVSDKRKCRPRGILNVGENDSGFGKGRGLCSFEGWDGNDEELVGDRDGLMVPLPTEASMHWMLSPCNEEDEEHKENSETSVQNPADVCCDNKLESSTCRSRRNAFVSPSGVPKFQALLEPLNELVPVLSSPPRGTPGCEALPLIDETQYIYDFDAENSPFSMASLDSGNVILTPQSDSSADGHAGLSWSNTDNRREQFDAEFSSVAEAIRMAHMSPNRHDVIDDQVDSSFQFDCLATTCNSISRIQKMLDDEVPWQFTTTVENVLQSQLRISWREGLMSHMDEYDCCRCLSDEEEDVNGCSDELVIKSCPSPEVTNNVGRDQTLPDTSLSADKLDDELGVAGKGKEDCPPQSCAESISTDGGGLLASGGSDWNLCYKNDLFHV